MKLTLNGPLESTDKQALYDSIKYIEENLLSPLGLHVRNLQLFFSVCDDSGNRVYPSLQGMDVAFVHNLYTGDYEVDVNPKYSCPIEYALPIDRLLSNRKTLPKLKIVDKAAAETLKKLRVNANMTVRQLCQKTGISGITICDYENGKKDVPDEDRVIIEKAIADFAANPETLDPVEEFSRLESTFPRPLSRMEKAKFCECISFGVTDEAIRNALEIGIKVTGRLNLNFTIRLLHHWVNKGLYGGEEVEEYKNHDAGLKQS